MLLLAFVVQPSAQHCHVTRYSRRTNKFSKVKDHGWLIANALRLHGFSVQRTMNLSVVTWKWLRNHPWIFLFWNLFGHTASHDAVRMKRSLCHSTGIDLVAQRIGSKSTMSMVEGSPLDMAPYVFVS